MPTSPSIVPMLFTGNEMTELPEPADFSRVPALLNDVPVAPLLFCRIEAAWKLKEAPGSLLIVVPVAALIEFVPVSRIVPVLVNVPERFKLWFPEIVSVPALVTIPATLLTFHCKTLPVKSRVAPLVPAPVNAGLNWAVEHNWTAPGPEPEPANVPEKLPLN